MAKIKLSFFRGYNALIGFFLSVLGFGTACSENGGNSPAEYGTPHGTFRVNGNVKSASTSNAVPKVRVVMGIDTATTDEKGDYEVSVQDMPTDQEFAIKFDDVDGEANGKYQALDTTVVFTNPKFTGGDGSWNSGETEQKLNVELKDKK